MKKLLACAAAMLAWVLCVVTAFGALQRYAAQAGYSHLPRGEIAAFLAAHRQPGRALVAMAVHPLCPCTDASLAELGDLLARSRGACDALLVEYQPLQPPPDWPAPTPTRRLGGVTVPVTPDPDGKFAALFGAGTSGHVLFVDAHGAISFRGGLTIARGHRGRSPAQDSILAHLASGKASISTAPVYGCALEAECKMEIAP